MVHAAIYIFMGNHEGDMERVEDWSPVHYAVLEFFSKHDIVIRPSNLAKNIDYTRNYVGQTCRQLADQDLLTQDDQFYELTDLGRAFIEGDVSAEDLRDSGD